MKYFTLLLFLIITAFASCDGRDRAQNSNKDNVVNSKLSDSFFESISYFPKEYTEVITDTILSNGYHVNLKFYSDMNKNVLTEFKIDTINYKHYYREFNTSIVASKDDLTIINKTINKEFIIKHDEKNKD